MWLYYVCGDTRDPSANLIEDCFRLKAKLVHFSRFSSILQ